MFPITNFHPLSMGFPFAGQQQQQSAPPSIYQSQYGGFHRQIPSAFAQAPPINGPYIGGGLPPLSPRRNQYPPSSQHYEYRRNPRSKSKPKQHQRRSASPRGAAEQSLYSDKERAETVEKTEDRSGSESPASVRGSKDDLVEGADHPHVNNVADEVVHGDTASAEEEKKNDGEQKRKSKSKKKKHHRADQERYSSPSNQRGTFYNGAPNGFSSPAKNPYPPGYGQPTDPSQYPYGTPPGYPSQPFNGVRPPFNPYPSYVGGGGPPNFFGNPFNTRPPWPPQGVVNSPADQEIQRLRHHIHSLESELHKLQKKLSKSTTQNHEESKRDTAGSPRQTPVIVELDNDARRTSKSKKHRTSSHQASQQDASFRERSPSPQEQSRGAHVSARYPPDPYQVNSNYNQSNNNDFFVDHRQQQEKPNLSAEKVLDAFERFYINRSGSTTAPMKVKFIPEESSTTFPQRNTNNE